MRLRAPRSAVAAAFKRAARPASSTPWRSARWCAVDLELTGLGPDDEIIAIGAVPIDDGRVMLGKALYTLARPSRAPSVSAVVVHKLRSADLSQAAPLDDAMELLLGVMSGRVPVFHTAAVERMFLGRELRRRRVRLPPSADTEALGRRWLLERDGSEPTGMSLARLAAALGQLAEPPHHALGDALTTAQAFVAVASHLDPLGFRTVGSLIEASRPPLTARRFGPM